MASQHGDLFLRERYPPFPSTFLIFEKFEIVEVLIVVSKAPSSAAGSSYTSLESLKG
jgi:hypothetical protein